MPPLRKHGHEIEWLGDVRPDDAAAIGQYVVDTTDRSAEWELLLDRGTVDGVLVGAGIAGAELRAEQLKRLVAEAMPLLVVHPIFLSVLPYYEIDMVRRETGAIVQHFNPLADHPMAAQLANWVRDTHPKIGTIHQLTAERRVANGDRATVLAALAPISNCSQP